MPARPKSIIQFEQVYWAIILLGIVSTALGWTDMMATVQVQRSVAHFGMAMVYAPVVFGLAIQLLLWFLIARRGNLIAKWVFVVLTALAIVFSGFSVVTGGAPTTVEAVVEVVSIVLQIVGIMLVFRPDTRAWFGEEAAAA